MLDKGQWKTKLSNKHHVVLRIYHSFSSLISLTGFMLSALFFFYHSMSFLTRSPTVITYAISLVDRFRYICIPVVDIAQTFVGYSGCLFIEQTLFEFLLCAGTKLSNRE